MALGKRRYRQAFDKINAIKEDEEYEIPGILGAPIGGEERVLVPNRDGYVYVRFRDDLAEIVQAYNDRVSRTYGLPVLVTRDKVDKGRWRIKGRDLGRYTVWGLAPYLPVHGDTHSFDPWTPGSDPVWVWGRQFMPLGSVPSGSVGGPNVIVEPSTYYQNTWKYAGGTGTANITPHNPTGSFSRMVLVYIDGDGNPQLEPGTAYFDISITGTSEVVPYIPALPETSGIPSAAIRLPSGTTKIMWPNIYDVRPHIVGDGFMPTGTYGHIIQEDGGNKPDRPYLNFVGDGLEVYDTGTQTNVSGTASIVQNLEYVDADYSAAVIDDYIMVTATGSQVYVWLPALGATRERPMTVKKLDSSANDVVVTGTAALIDGQGAAALQIQYEAIKLYPGLSEWHIV